MKKMQKGFTLIELMIVVAIIAILAAIALPAYQDYVARSQVSEAASLASGARTAVAEEFANRGVFTGIDNTTAGLAAATSINGEYVNSVTVNNGVVTANMRNGTPTSGKVQNGNLVFSPSDRGGSIAWTCKAGSNMDPKYLPSSCRD